MLLSIKPNIQSHYCNYWLDRGTIQKTNYTLFLDTTHYSDLQTRSPNYFIASFPFLSQLHPPTWSGQNPACTQSSLLSSLTSPLIHQKYFSKFFKIHPEHNTTLPSTSTVEYHSLSLSKRDHTSCLGVRKFSDLAI